jgi:hypothetical protein
MSSGQVFTQMSLSGLGLYRNHPDMAMTPRWLVIQYGTLLIFMDEVSQVPEECVCLSGASYKRGGMLEGGEELISVDAKDDNGNPIKLELGMESYESPLWSAAIKLHSEAHIDVDASEIKTIVKASVDEYNDEVEAITAEVSFNKVPQYITVGVDDDVTEKVNEFLQKHAPTRVDEYFTLVENLVLKMLLESFQTTTDRQKKHAAFLRRKLSSVVVAEKRALSAEDHAGKISDSITIMDKNISILSQNLADAKEASESKSAEITRLAGLLTEAGETIKHEKERYEQLKSSSEHTTIHSYEEKLSESSNKMKELETELSRWRTADNGDNAVIRKELQYALKELKEARRQKVLKDKQLQEAKRDADKASYELRIMYGYQAGLKRGGSKGSGSVTPNKDSSTQLSPNSTSRTTPSATPPNESNEQISEIYERMQQTEDQLTLAVQDKEHMEESLRIMKREYDTTKQQLESAKNEAQRLRGVHGKDSEIHALEIRLNAVNTENKSMKSIIMKHRGEVQRLTNKLQEVRHAAIQAVQLLNTLNPDSKAMEMLSKAMAHSTLQASGPVSPNKSNISTASLSASTAIPSVSSPIMGRGLSPTMLITGKHGGSSIKGNMGYPMTSPPTATPMVAARRQWVLSDDIPNLDELIVVADIRLKILYMIFEKYSNDQNLITHSRFIRFAKEFALTPHASGQSVHNIAPQDAPMLVAGDIDLIFKAAIKSDPDDRKAPFGTGPRMFVKRSQTAAASNMVFHQFVHAISMLARKLYANVIEERYGTALEYLPSDQREPAALGLIVVLLNGKILKGLEIHNMVPFTLFFTETVIDTLARKADMYSTIADNAATLVQWFDAYADVFVPGALVGDPPTSISFKSILRFGQELGIVPFLARETQFFAMFEEVLLWRLIYGVRVLTSLPSELLTLSRVEISDIETSQAARLKEKNGKPTARTAAVGFPSADIPETLKSLGIESHKGSLGPATLTLFICIVAQQAFPAEPEGKRLEALFSWMSDSSGTPKST